MKKLFFLLSILFFSILKAQTPAFPSAEGDGMYTTGGRGGQILYVTKLTDDLSTGTLRWAINQSGARIILFKVAGLIPLTSELRIKNGNLTIAGQSAPGDGICIKNYPVVLQASNVIIRFMRFRMGDEAAEAAKLAGNTAYGWDGADAFWGRDMTDVILDHCSMSWNIDECSSFYDNKRFTMQWCFMAESMRNSVHSKGAHGYGGIWGGEPATYHHNILAFHDSRNPRFCGSRYTNSPSTELVNFVNNVIYNWGGNSGYAGEGGRYNMINNYYRSGAATGSSAKYRIFSPNADAGDNAQPIGVWGTFYLTGNVMKNNPEVNTNNWLGFQPVSLGTKSITDLESSVPFLSPVLTTQTATDAYLSVTAYAGASLKRDAVDTRVATNILNGTISCSTGSNGSTGGFIDSQKDVGGWPTYTFDPNAVPVDTDGDGMPDSWETAHGLDPNNASDGSTKTLDGNYTNVEIYLNELVKPVTDVQAKITATENVFSQSLKIYPNPVTNGNISINADNTIVSAQMFSLNGIKLNEFKTGSNSLSVPMDKLKTGAYILKITLENGNSIPTIILKQ
jgi:hypothetical protein